MITEEDILRIIDITEKENEFALTKRQVNNIRKALDEYGVDDKLTLEYASRIKCLINNYVIFQVKESNDKRYYGVRTIDYSVRRALFNSREIDEIDPVFDPELEDSLVSLEISFRFENKSLKLDNKKAY